MKSQKHNKTLIEFERKPQIITEQAKKKKLRLCRQVFFLDCIAFHFTQFVTLITFLLSKVPTLLFACSTTVSSSIFFHISAYIHAHPKITKYNVNNKNVKTDGCVINFTLNCLQSQFYILALENKTTNNCTSTFIVPNTLQIT